MDINKENPTKDNFKSKIPVPLSRLPNHLMTNVGRAPLETISKTNIKEKSFSYLAYKKSVTDGQKNITFRTCTRRVITDLKFNKNWDSEVYKELSLEETNCSDTYIIEYKASEISAGISDKEIDTKVNVKDSFKSEPEEEIINGVKDTKEPKNHLDTPQIDETEDVELEQNNTLRVGEFNNVVTPTTLIQHKGIKNIKKSLKRPHSRELQRLSPEFNVELEIKVKRRLFDRLEDKLPSSDGSKTYAKCLAENYVDDIFQYLYSVENKPRGIPCIKSVTRTCLINWLIKLNGTDGNPAVIQAACWYLDSYLSSAEFPLMKLQVVAAACYWIAQKLHGPSYSASKLVFCGNNAFTTEELRAMEMKVLNELQFPRQPVVPQEYITYMSSWCSKTEDKEIEMGATFLCLAAMMMDKTLCMEYPSVIAGSAMKSAILFLKKTHLMNRLIMCPEYQKSLMKTRNLSFGSTFRSAVRTISNPAYEYNSLWKQYGVPPYSISQKMVEAVKQHNVTVRTQVQLEN